MNVGGPLRWALVAAGLVFTPCFLSIAQQPDAPSAQSFHMELSVNKLLVPVVVRDAQGRVLSDLKKGDFQVFDQGKPRAISGFSVLLRGAKSRPPEPVAQPSAASRAAPDAILLPERITVFLFDDMHMGVEDLAHARAAGANVVSAALTGTDMAAVVSISGSVNSGLTRDLAKLQHAIAKLQPRSLYHSDSMECPSIDYYQADLIENKHDPVAIQDAVRKFANCNPAVSRPQDLAGSQVTEAQNLIETAASKALILGRQDAQSTYASIANLVRKMAQLPGQRTLILVSSGFLNIERDSLNAESHVIDIAAQSNVTISALDARGLYTTELTASEKSPALSGPSLQVNSEFHRSGMRLSENTLAEMADGTGGTFFHNSNDLNSGLKELTETPACIYVLELSLDGVKQNGTFHALKVKVDREDATLEARRGYVIPKPEKQH